MCAHACVGVDVCVWMGEWMDGRVDACVGVDVCVGADRSEWMGEWMCV